METTDNLKIRFIFDKKNFITDVINGKENSDGVLVIDVVECIVYILEYCSIDDVNRYVHDSTYVWIKKEYK